MGGRGLTGTYRTPSSSERYKILNKLQTANITVTVTLLSYLPTYSLGGDSRRSARPVMGLPMAFSSSVLLVSTISLSSVEITCCCLRGFFLGEAPGIKSPMVGVFRVEVCVVRAGADDKFTLASTVEKAHYVHITLVLFKFIISDGQNVAHLVGRYPWSPPPALSLNPGRQRLLHRLQCY